jgi:hypothetical protein
MVVFHDGEQITVRLHRAAELKLRNGRDALRACLPEADDAARQMPAASEGAVVTPREQRLPRVVLDEKIDAYERRMPAHKEEHLFGQFAVFAELPLERFDEGRH